MKGRYDNISYDNIVMLWNTRYQNIKSVLIELLWKDVNDDWRGLDTILDINLIEELI